MEWQYYCGQPLESADLIYCDKGGLAFIDSGLTTGEPSKISSMPENWSCDINALSQADGLLRDCKGKVFDKAIKFMRVEI